MNMQDAIRSKEEVEVDDKEEEAEAEGGKGIRTRSSISSSTASLSSPSLLKLLPPRKTQISTTHLLGNSNLSFFLLLSFPLPIFSTFSLKTTVLVVGTSTATSGSITFLKINRTL